jgi:type II secretory pathway pseudopilin PulG
MRRKKHESGEEGFLLIAVLFVLALLLFALATAAPRVSYDLRRDRELETVHRGMQYARAIQLYYRKFGHYPVSMDELVESNHIRFLRRKYTDPMTGKPDWRLIHVGQSKTLSIGGPAAQVGVPAGQAGLSGASPSDPNSLFGQSGAGSILGAQGSPGLQGGQTPGGIFVGSSPTGNPDQPPMGNPDQPPGGSILGSPSDSGPGGSPSSPGAPGASGLPGLSSNQPGDATPGSNAGGGPIMGVSSTNPGSAIKIIKKMQHYNEWEFIYDPSLDAGGAGGANGLQQPGASGAGQQNPFQSSPGGSPTPSPTPAPTPTSQQQQ